MDEYLALIRKADFIDLFKYGYFHVNRDLSIPVIGDMDYIRSHKRYLNNFADHANCFESSFEYLFLLYSENREGRPKDIKIENVFAVIPLDDEAKREFAMSFDERIRIEEPLWPEAVTQFQKEKDFESCKQGARNLWQIWGIKDNIEEYEQIITDDIIHDVIDMLYENRRPIGDLPLWEYLIRYERHAFYPKNVTGVFMDTVNVFCNYLRKEEVDSVMVESTGVYKFLDSISKQNLKLNTILSLLNKKASPFIEQIKEVESRVDFVKTSALYLFLKQHYSDGIVYEERFIEGCKNGGEKEFNVATYILGVVLGYSNTYDCLYDRLPLKIFQNRKDTNAITLQNPMHEVIKEPKPLAVDHKPTETEKLNPVSELFLFGSQITQSESNLKRPLPHFPCRMRKYNKNGEPSNAKGSIKIVKTPETYLELKKSKYDWRVDVE